MPDWVATTLMLYEPVAVMSVQLGAVLQTVSAPVEELILNFPASVPLIDQVPENAGEEGLIVAVAVKTRVFAEPATAAKLPLDGATDAIDCATPVIATAWVNGDMPDCVATTLIL